MFNSGMSFVPLEHAVRDGHSDIAVVAREVGARAAQMGVPLHEVMDHVERAHAPEEPSFATVRAAALAWVEEALVAPGGCVVRAPVDVVVDGSACPLPARRRLSGGRAGRRSELRTRTRWWWWSCRALEPGNELEQSLRALEVAEAMRMVFAGDETIAQLSPRRFAALAAIERTPMP